jgi:hypothetical protein
VKRLDIAAFAEITRRVIARDGFDSYLPTLCLPARKHISVLEGIPAKKLERVRDIALAWAEEKAGPDAEYFLAYKEDADRFRIVHRHSAGREERLFSAHPELR